MEFKNDTHFYIDLPKLYDSIQRKGFFLSLSEFCIPTKLISLNRITLNIKNVQLKLAKTHHDVKKKVAYADDIDIVVAD